MFGAPMPVLPRVFDTTFKPAYQDARGTLNRALERRAGIRTEGRILPEQLGFEGEHCGRYQPAGWYQLRRILKPREVTPEDVFLDLGSGMGRVVYQAAAWYAFKRVIGVELSDDLNQVARNNIARTRPRLRCREVEFITADARDYPVPDDLTVLYLNNPFTGPIFGAALDNILASLERNPRRLRVIYGNPREERALLGAGFRLVRALRGWRPTPEWSRSNSVRMYERGG